MTRHTKRPGCRVAAGFTLIELLVVIAIIALLAAILFPVFAKAREKSFQTTCINNQRQLATAIGMYLQDNDAMFFPNPVTMPWCSAIKNFTGSSALYSCPTQNNGASDAAPNYGFNSHLFGQPEGNLGQPSLTIMTIDQNVARTGSNYVVTYFTSSEISNRHNNGTILSCVDGHIAYEQIPAGLDTRLALMSSNATRPAYVVGPPSPVIYGTIPGPITAVNYSGSNGQYGSAVYNPMPAGSYLTNTATATSIPDYDFEFDMANYFSGNNCYIAVNFFDPGGAQNNVYVGNGNGPTWSNAYNSLTCSASGAAKGEQLLYGNSAYTKVDASWMLKVLRGDFHVKMELLNNGTILSMTTTKTGLGTDAYSGGSTDTFAVGTTHVLQMNTTFSSMLTIVGHSQVGIYLEDTSGGTVSIVKNLSFGIEQ